MAIKALSRKAKEALIQAGKVRAALAAIDPTFEFSIEAIKTMGDRTTDVPLHRINATGLFVRELEQALLQDRIDIAVHSLKDMPSILPVGLSTTAVLERDDPRDALIRPLRPAGADAGGLRGSETVGTSSLRRKAQLLNRYPDLAVVDIRGNIETRISKVDIGHGDAIILAACGMDRAGYADRITFRFPVEDMLPAACQGIIAVEQRSDDSPTALLLGRINHAATMIRADAERSYLRTIEGGCSIPVGCFSEIERDEIRIEGMVALDDGSALVRISIIGATDLAERLGEELAERVLAEGGREILESYGS